MPRFFFVLLFYFYNAINLFVGVVAVWFYYLPPHIEEVHLPARVVDSSMGTPGHAC